MTPGKALRLAFGIVAVGALVWLLNHIGWAEVAAGLRQVGWPTAVLLLGLGLVESACDTLALGRTLPARVPPHRLLGYQCAGALLNTLVPMDAGEVLKGTLLSRHLPSGDVISGLVVWNYIGKISRPLFATTAVLVGFALGGSPGARAAWLVSVATALSFAPYLALRLALRTGIAGVLVRLGHKLRILKRDHLVWEERAKRLDHALKYFWQHRPRDFMVALALQLMGRIANMTSMLVTLSALGVSIGFPRRALLFAAQSGSEYLLMFLPKVGVAEGAGFFIFGLFGVANALGVLTAFIMRLRGIASNALGALLTFAPLGAGDRNGASAGSGGDRAGAGSPP